MKIGFVSTYFYPVMGGAESNCFYIAKELAKRHEVHIFTSNKGNFPPEELFEGMHIHRSKTWWRFGYYTAFYPSMMKQLLKYDLDVLHFHSFGFPWHDKLFLLKKLLSKKTKFVITPRGPFMALGSYPSWQKALGAFVQFGEHLVNPLYDLVIQVNPTQTSWLPDYSFKKEKVEFFPNGIPESMFQKSRPLKEFEKKFVISYVGRVQRYKGLDQVVKILPALVEKNKDIVLVLAGDPEDELYLSKLAKELKVEDHLKILGRVSEEEKLSLLGSSKIFVFPSKWEAFGISTLEAMAKGNLIISSKTEGGKFLVEKENGYLFDFGDLETLKKIMLKAVSDKKALSMMGKNNIEKAKCFTWEKISKDIEEAYKR